MNPIKWLMVRIAMAIREAVKKDDLRILRAWLRKNQPKYQAAITLTEDYQDEEYYHMTFYPYTKEGEALDTDKDLEACITKLKASLNMSLSVMHMEYDDTFAFLYWPAKDRSLQVEIYGDTPEYLKNLQKET